MLNIKIVVVLLLVILTNTTATNTDKTTTKTSTTSSTTTTKILHATQVPPCYLTGATQNRMELCILQLLHYSAILDMNRDYEQVFDYGTC